MFVKVTTLRLLAPIFSLVWLANGVALGATTSIVVLAFPLEATTRPFCEIGSRNRCSDDDWATWPGGPPPMPLDRMYADALAYQGGSVRLATRSGTCTKDVHLSREC